MKDSHASKETEKEVKKRTKGRFLGWIQDYGRQKRHENNEKAERKPNAEKMSTRSGGYPKKRKKCEKSGKKSRKLRRNSEKTEKE